MWLTSHDWVNEATWRWRLLLFGSLYPRDRHFLAPEIAAAELFFSFYFVREQRILLPTETRSPGLSGCASGKRLINLIFIMWWSLLIYAEETRYAPLFANQSGKCKSIGSWVNFCFTLFSPFLQKPYTKHYGLEQLKSNIWLRSHTGPTFICGSKSDTEMIF